MSPCCCFALPSILSPCVSYSASRLSTTSNTRNRGDRRSKKNSSCRYCFLLCNPGSGKVVVQCLFEKFVNKIYYVLQMLYVPISNQASSYPKIRRVSPCASASSVAHAKTSKPGGTPCPQ